MLARSMHRSFGVVAQIAAAAIEFKDWDAQGHNRRVADLCIKIGRQLGMPAGDLQVLARSGLLHDVGKLDIPDRILEKHCSLDDAEWVLIRTHPELGLAILGRAGNFDRELLAVLYHHERMDGSGYPRGLVADAIPIEARIVAVADTYDVLTHDRPYRTARSREEAQRVLLQEARSHLDPRVVAALIRVLVRQHAAPPVAWRNGLRAASAWSG